MTRLWVAVVAAIVLLGFTAPEAAARPRGRGTLLIMQDANCQGHGESAFVHYPFAGLFTGFEPHASGSVTAYTQPGGLQVGYRSVTVDDQGNRCELVLGTAPPGQYKFVYEFGSGTGKQKVVRIVVAPLPTPSASVPGGSESASVPGGSESGSVPGGSESASVPGGSESASVPGGSESASVPGGSESASVPGGSESASVPTSSASSAPPAASASATGTGAPGASAAPSSSVLPSSGTSVLGEQIFFHPLANSVGDAATLARTGSRAPALLGLAAILLASGAALVLVGRRRGRRA